MKTLFLSLGGAILGWGFGAGHLWLCALGAAIFIFGYMAAYPRSNF